MEGKEEEGGREASAARDGKVGAAASLGNGSLALYGSSLVLVFQPVGFWGLGFMVTTLLAATSVSSPWAEVEIVYAAGFLGWASSGLVYVDVHVYTGINSHRICSK